MAEATPPAVKQDDFLTLLKAYTPPKSGREKDVVAGRYRIQLNQPLAEFNSPFTKAYVARDNEAPDAALYALVFDNNAPVRQKNISALKNFRHPNMVALLAEGLVDINTPIETRYACIMERPSGQTLAQYLSQEKEPFSETALMHILLRPMADILSAMGDMGISHNRINLRNLYINNETIILGECISQPSGFTQDPIFEPIERLLLSDWSKPDFAIGADGYALAMVALHLLLGYQPYAGMDKEAIIDEILSKGSLHAFVIPWDLPSSLQDLFRGVLNDNSRERWNMESLKSWANGRRFNLILPPPARETPRGFEFAGQTHFTRRSLGHAMARNWQAALKLLFDSGFLRWIESSIQKPDISDAIIRLINSGNAETIRTERQNSLLLARVLILLDPSGPIRLRHISAHAEAMGSMLARSFLGGKKEDLDTTTEIIENDLAGFWIEQQKPAGNEYAALTTKLQKARKNIRKPALGFGVERCLYDLLPSLPCLSPMLTRFRCSTLADVLVALDTIAPQKAAQEDCIDRHIAGFVASKLDFNQEVRLSELEMIPHMVSHQALVALTLLLKAQGKTRDTDNLKGLSYWMAIRLLPLLDNIHKRQKRRELQLELRDMATQGSLQAITDTLLSSQAFATDIYNFQKTASDYAVRSQQITALKNNTYLARHSRMLGRGFAQSVAFSVCFVTVYYTLKSYFHF